MLTTYKEYKEWRKYEGKEWNLKSFFFPEPTDTFIKWLRRTELTYNSRGVLRLLFPFCYWKYRRMMLATGISIPKNVCDKGLFVPHFGGIVVNSASKIGRNCMIQSKINVGANGGGKKLRE